MFALFNIGEGCLLVFLPHHAVDLGFGAGGGAPMTVWAQTLRMRVVPRAEHGRLFALLRTAMQATYPLGAGLAVMGLPVLLLAGVRADVTRSGT